MLPVIVALLVGMVWILLRIHRSIVGTAVKSQDSRAGSRWARAWRMLTSPQRESASIYQIHAIVRTVLLLLTFVYLPVAKSVLEYFK